MQRPNLPSSQDKSSARGRRSPASRDAINPSLAQSLSSVSITEGRGETTHGGNDEDLPPARQRTQSPSSTTQAAAAPVIDFAARQEVGRSDARICSSSPTGNSAASSSSSAQPPPQSRVPVKAMGSGSANRRQVVQGELETRRRDMQQVNELMQRFFEPGMACENYKVEKLIGQGASSKVCSARDLCTRTLVAIKRVTLNEQVSVRILRELKFLRYLRGHENIVRCHGILDPAQHDDFRDVFIVFELMPCDLERALRQPHALTGEHVRYLMYQLLRGIMYMHSCGIHHRDLKPSNLLIDTSCSLKICDFGLARAAFEDEDLAIWTGYVATRWYRPPELIGTHVATYSGAVDIWSVGCIFAEMLSNGQPIFNGHNNEEMLKLMTKTLGSPSQNAIKQIKSRKVQMYLRSQSNNRAPSLGRRFPGADPMALDLLVKLLDFDPTKRPSASEALKHPYFNGLRDGNEPVGKPMSKREFEFETKPHRTESLRPLFLSEIEKYKALFGTSSTQEPDASGRTNFENEWRREQSGHGTRGSSSAPAPTLKLTVARWQAKRKAQGRPAPGPGTPDKKLP